MKQYLFTRAIRKQKERAIFEISKDLEFMRKFKGEMLTYNEGPARKRMAELKGIEEPSGIEESELETIQQVIAESKAVKLEYKKSQQVMDELIQYLEIL